MIEISGEIEWGWVFRLVQVNGGKIRNKQLAFINPNLSVAGFLHFKFFLHALFLMDILDILIGWYLKVKFINFTFVTFSNLCLQLFRPSYGFNLSDPYCRLLENQYKSLHDPHLRAYHTRKDILRRLKKGGYITSNNKVGWKLLPFNYRRLPSLDISLLLYLTGVGMGFHL